MSVLLRLNFTPDDNVVPKIKSLEQEEPMVSYEKLKSVTKPNGSVQSLGGTSDEVLKKNILHPLDIHSVNKLPAPVNVVCFPRW